jgi:molecular chaperone IbpA
MALAGYKKEDINITHENGVLTVSHVKPKAEFSKAKVIHNGITKKSFSKPFAVADSVIVESATFVDGLLTISLKDTTPEPKKNKIEIN